MKGKDDTTEYDRQHAELLRRLGPGPGGRLKLKDRQVVKKIGCYNCVHWNNELWARTQWTTRRGRDIATLMGQGHSLAQAEGMLQKHDARYAPPRSGLCMKGKAQTDFVMFNYHCNHWTGRINPKDHPGEQLEPTPLEYRAVKLGEKVDPE